MRQSSPPHPNPPKHIEQIIWLQKWEHYSQLSYHQGTTRDKLCSKNWKPILNRVGRPHYTGQNVLPMACCLLSIELSEVEKKKKKGKSIIVVSAVNRKQRRALVQRALGFRNKLINTYIYVYLFICIFLLMFISGLISYFIYILHMKSD